ncbi:MAG: hypothetical protein MUC51_08210 [Anaerolineae bacterium]|nr:hypothetical protein [Anaerolineae bacterium]
MSSNVQKSRPTWVLPVIGFLIGLLIGWWVIGWGIWPVQWTNALPPDLRAGERDEYLTMVAESYAASGNGDMAKSRLATWSPQALSRDLANLQTRLASNPQQAAKVLALSQLVGAGSTTAPGAQAPGKVAPPTARPGAAPSSASGTDTVETLRTVGTVLLWLVLFGVALAVVVYFWRRWRVAHAVQPGPVIDASTRPARSVPPAQPSFSDVSAEEAQWTSNYPPPVQTDDMEPLEPPVEPEPPAAAVVAAASAATAPARPPTGTAPTPPKVTPAVAAGAMVATTKVGEFRPHYTMGEPDYDEPFDIIDSAGGYLGQCGLELNDPVGRGHDQAAALQVWLWDTNDQDTKVKVLMSEGAYRDTAIRDQLKGEHEALSIRPGAEFELNSYKLVLRGTVEKLEYANQEPANLVFSDLLIRLQVYRKA